MKTALEKKMATLNVIAVGEWDHDSKSNTYVNNSKEGVKVEIQFKQSTTYSISQRTRTESKTKYRVYVYLYVDGKFRGYIYDKSATGESKKTDETIEKIVSGLEKQAQDMGISDLFWVYS